MGYSQLLLINFLAFFLISSFAHKTSIAQAGRPMSNAAVAVKGGEEKFTERALIGSRPPNCERRCSSCVRCEAIQVPIVPQQKHLKPKEILNSRGDNLSNYKPVSWKCKCGNFIFNP